MAKPTERALKRKPSAIILMTWQAGKSSGEPGDWDFEWFESADNMSEFWKVANEWNAQDVIDHTGTEALVYLNAIVPDTATLEVTEWSIHPETDETRAILARFQADPSLIITPAPAVVAKTGDGKVKAKRASSAKEAVTKGVDADKGEGPKPKARVRKPAATSETKVADDGTDAKAKALKERLAAKATPKTDAVPGDEPSKATA